MHLEVFVHHLNGLFVSVTPKALLTKIYCHSLPADRTPVYRGCPCRDLMGCPLIPKQNGIRDKAPTLWLLQLLRLMQLLQLLHVCACEHHWTSFDKQKKKRKKKRGKKEKKKRKKEEKEKVGLCTLQLGQLHLRRRQNLPQETSCSSRCVWILRYAHHQQLARLPLNQGLQL